MKWTLAILGCLVLPVLAWAEATTGPAGEARDVAVDLWLEGAAVHVTAAQARFAGETDISLTEPRVDVGEELSVRAGEAQVTLDPGAVEASDGVEGVFVAEQPVEIRAERFRIDVKAGTGVFEGAVVVTQGTLVLVCEHLSVEYDSRTQDVRSVTATGAVEIRQGDRLGRGETAVFDRATGTVVLSGSPYLEQGNVKLRGSTIRFDASGGEISCEGCRAIFGAGS